MMMEFTCFGCGREIHSEDQLIGEWVKCPICSTSQVVPDPIIPNGAMYYKNYTIKSFEDENMLWQSYRVSCARHAKGRDAVLRVPSTFFIKNVSDFDAFSEAASFSGWQNIEGFAKLTDNSTVKGKEYFVYDIGEDFFPISTFVEKRGPLGVKVAVSIISGIVSSFSKSWKKARVSHLNICPSTICISTQTMKPLILDMGLSIYLLQDNALHEKGFHVWDVRYMAPEIRNGEGPSPNPSADIYSLGAVLYFLITGVHPFKDKAMKKYEKFPEFPVGTDVPETLRSVALKMTAYLPEYRFYSWDDLISALDKVMYNMDKTEVDISSEGKHAIKKQYRALSNTMDSSRTCTGITQTYITSGVKIKLEELRVQNNDRECDNPVACATASIPEVQGIAWRKFFNVDFRFMVATIALAASVVLIFLIYQTYTDRSMASSDTGDINAAVPAACPKTSCSPVPGDTVAGSESNSWDIKLSAMNDIMDIGIDDFTASRGAFYDRPRPAGLVYNDLECQSYLDSLPLKLRTSERSRMEIVKSAKEYFIRMLERNPYEGERGMILFDGMDSLERKLTVTMANEHMLIVKASQGGYTDRIQWEDLDFRQYELFFEYFISMKEKTSGGGREGVARKKQTASDYLVMSVLCDWYGRYGKSLNYAKKGVIADPKLRNTANSLLIINDASVNTSQSNVFCFNETPIKAAPVVIEKPCVKESEKEKPADRNVKPNKVNTVLHEKAVDSKKTMDDELIKPLMKLVAGKDFAKAREFIDKNMSALSMDETELSSIKRTIGDLARLNDVLVKALEDKNPGFKISFVQGGRLCEGELISFTGNDLWVATTIGKNKIKTKISLDVLPPDTVISLAGGSISGEALMLFAYLKASELGDAISSRKYLDLSQGALSRYLKGSLRIAKNCAD